MSGVTERASRILDAAADIEDLLRLAHEATHRIHQDVHEDSFEHVKNVSEKIHQLRLDARQLHNAMQLYVNSIASYR